MNNKSNFVIERMEMCEVSAAKKNNVMNVNWAPPAHSRGVTRKCPGAHGVPSEIYSLRFR
jgi:hypothetical protein